MRAPTNTEEQARTHPLAVLAEAVMHGDGSKAIVAQEARGQREFVTSDTLPSDIKEADKAVLIACGFRFIGPVDGDPLFQFVEMPKGWTKKATDHSMWSKLVDDKGRERGSIFYKAAFYDRAAHLHLERRFTTRRDYARRDEKREAVSQVMDGDTCIFETAPRPVQEGYAPEVFKIIDEADAEALAWLVARYPNHANTAAYWE